MKLIDVVSRQPSPEPWSEGETIPWHDPAFSRRMLKEHLSQEHDHASRRFETVDRHVRWIHGELLAGRPGRILDLACGPGLYSSRLARLGHECLGIDYSPASIEYARDEAAREGLSCRYLLEDVRRAEYGEGFSLAMLIYGEFNVFSPGNAATILQKACRALVPGGLLLLEPHPYDYVERLGRAPAGWYSAEGGLFSERPHLYLQENHWDEGRRAATTRYYIVDAATGEVTRHAGSMQAYADDDYRALLGAQGFRDVRFYPALAPAEGQARSDLIAIVAAK